jgi:hypothetical protein
MIRNILTIGGIGSLIFTCIILLMLVTGIASEMRDEEGDFRKSFNWKTLIGGIAFISFLFSLLYIGNVNYIISLHEKPNLFQLWLNSFGIFLVVQLYDLIILDYLVIVKWHPKILKLPETEYYRTLAPHVKGFVKGIPIGIIASLVASLFSVAMQ